MLPATLHGGTQFGDSPAPGQSTLVETLGRPLTMAETLEEPTEPLAQRPRPPRRGPWAIRRVHISRSVSGERQLPHHE